MLSRTRSRRHFLQRSAALASVGLLAGCGALPSLTRQPAKVRRIGYLAPRVLPLANDPFRQALPDLGWIEGENLVIEVRSADLQFERLPALADELVRAGVELIYAPLSSAASAVQQATRTIPIVFAGTADPVAEGLVASLAHPGGNLTGLSLAISELMAKRVQLLKEMAPGITRLAVLRDIQSAGTPVLESMLRAVEEGARAYDLEIRYVDQVGPEPAQLEQAFSLVLPERPDALFVVPAPTLTPLAPRIAELAIANRLPAIAADLDFPRSGLLLSYGANYGDLTRRAATYVDKILKGAKPADLPVEKPIVFDFGINLKTAQALGLTIPQVVLAQATEVIQ
jgi:putative ABC transport system substrate-binding protein